jgi:hypothetical protein
MDKFFLGLWLGVVLMLVTAAFIVDKTNDSWRDQIAKHGCAHYYLDDNSQRQWDWIKP